MTEAALALLVGALAGAQATETLHHGSIFAPWREKATDWSSKRGVRKFVGDLLRCPFCLAHWTCGLAIAGLWFLPPAATWPIYALAATRLAQILNDVLHPWTRSPSDTEIALSLEEDSGDSE